MQHVNIMSEYVSISQIQFSGWSLVENEGMKLYMDIMGIHSLIPY